MDPQVHARSEHQVDAFLALCDRISVGDAVSQHPPSTSPPRRSSEYTDGSRRAENAHAPIPRRRRASAADAPIVRPPTLFCSDESPEAGEAGGTQEFLPPPPHLGLPAPNGAPAAAEVQQVFETLLDMFPGRHHADLFAIAGSSNSLEAAITSVIQTQTLEVPDSELPPPPEEDRVVPKVFTDSSEFMPPPPVLSDHPPPVLPHAIHRPAEELSPEGPVRMRRQTPERHPRERVQSVMSVMSTDTDAGFALCPPPSDAVLQRDLRAYPKIADKRRSIQIATSSGEYSGFEGADTESNRDVHERAIPATDTNLRRTVEDLVESRLLRGSYGEFSGSGSDTESVASGVSAEALSKIVAQTVDRMLKDRGDTTPRNSTLSTGSGYTLSGSPRNSDAFDPDPPLPSTGGPGSNGTISDNSGRDSRYIAGNATLEQLSPSKHTSARARARDRIQRLVSGKGTAITGQRIVVKRDRLLGFGFAISGEAPVYVHSVSPGGPCDRGVDGLMPGDVILKVGDVPCARSTRDAVLDLVDSDEVGDFLYVVVARTPQPVRKGIPATASASAGPRKAGRQLTRVGSGRASSRRPSKSKVASFSGWLSILTMSNNRMVWDRFWVVLNDGMLLYYHGPDSLTSAPLQPEGSVPLEDATCSLCSSADRIKRDFAFRICHDAHPPLYLSGPNMTNVQEWIKHINRAVDEASSYGFDV